MPVEAITPEFRAAAESDVPTLVDLVNSAYRGDSSRRGWTTEADFLSGQRSDSAGMAELLARPDTTVLLAETEAQLVACCELQWAGAREAYFGMFAVSPERQGAGLGKLVLGQAEHFVAAQWRAQWLRMKVIRQRENLISWYERRGYRRTGITTPFPYGDEQFGIPQRSDLEFEELVRELPTISADNSSESG